MSCEICRAIDGHSYRCPYFKPNKTIYSCSFCGEGIYEGETYLMNDLGEYRHYDCFYNTEDILNWLGYKIHVMAEEI